MVIMNFQITFSDWRGSDYASIVNSIRLDVYFFSEAAST